MDEFADGRTCVLPECHLVPRAKFALSTDPVDKKRIENPVYRNVSKWNHTQSLSELTRLSATFQRAEVSHDRSLLNRLYYRNHNQHRSAIHFRHLSALRRGLCILDQSGLQSLILQLATSFFPANAGKGSRKPALWQSLPCSHFVTAAAVRISRLLGLVDKLRDICETAYKSFAAQTAQSLFVPLALTVQAICARLHLVFGLWRDDLIAIYALLLQWLPCLPACPSSLGNLTPAIAAKLVHPDQLVNGTGCVALKPVPVADDMDVDLPSPMFVAPKEKKRARQRALDLYDE
ncbi:hypothetical protein GGI20_004085 [Coemansia sp. BCRC 34301]|nr:hypothetical protein GGI20_004085 [Coemansia sp. BCRC 34301]